MDNAETVVLSRTSDSSPAPGDSLEVPRQLGPVRLLRQIGQGGMGVVWLGFDDMLKREVAVKFLLGAVASEDDPRFSTFLEGAQAAAALKNPNQTAVLNAGVIQNTPYIVMEYVNGPALSSLLHRFDKMTLPPVLALFEPVCSALSACHEQGLVHRDIKPANILLDEESRVFLTDFGLARAAPAGVRGAEGAGVAGTPAYMAPEMFDGVASPRTDVYALGITAYELLTGRPPFAGSLAEMTRQHKEEPLPLEPLRQAKVLDLVIETIERAAHKDAMFRHKTAAHFFRALQQAVTDKAVWARSQRDLARLVSLWHRPVGEAPGETTQSAGTSGGGAKTPHSPTPTPAQTYYDTIGARAATKRRAAELTSEAAPQSASPAPEGVAALGSTQIAPASGQPVDPGVFVASYSDAAGDRPAPMPPMTGGREEQSSVSRVLAGREPRSPAWQPPPPTEPGELGIAPRETVWPVVVGVVSIVLGTLSTLGGALGLIMQAYVRAAEPSERATNPMLKGQDTGTIGTGLSIATVLLGALLILGGFGLFRRRGWAMPMLLAWAALKVLLTIADTARTFIKFGEILPVTTAGSTNVVESGIGVAMKYCMTAGLLLWGIALPVFFFIWFRRSQVKVEMAVWRRGRTAA